MKFQNHIFALSLTWALFSSFSLLKKLQGNTCNIKFTILTIFSVQFSGIKCIHIIVQLLPLLISRTLFNFKTDKLYPLSNNYHSFLSQSLVQFSSNELFLKINKPKTSIKVTKSNNNHFYPCLWTPGYTALLYLNFGNWIPTFSLCIFAFSSNLKSSTDCHC